MQILQNSYKKISLKEPENEDKYYKIVTKNDEKSKKVTFFLKNTLQLVTKCCIIVLCKNKSSR